MNQTETKHDSIEGQLALHTAMKRIKNTVTASTIAETLTTVFVHKLLICTTTDRSSGYKHVFFMTHNE